MPPAEEGERVEREGLPDEQKRFGMLHCPNCGRDDIDDTLPETNLWLCERCGLQGSAPEFVRDVVWATYYDALRAELEEAQREREAHFKDRAWWREKAVEQHRRGDSLAARLAGVEGAVDQSGEAMESAFRSLKEGTSLPLFVCHACGNVAVTETRDLTCERCGEPRTMIETIWVEASSDQPERDD